MTQEMVDEEDKLKEKLMNYFLMADIIEFLLL